MIESILKLKGVCKKYPSFELKDVSFSVEKGEIVGFIGRNGAGKTTTLKAIMNLIAIDKGEIFAFGSDFRKNTLEAKQKIGFSLSEINYYPDNKLKSISAVIKKCYKNFDDSMYRELLDEFSLNENKKIKELSSGMKVKYSLALALSHNAELLILDEPTSGLDPISRYEIIELFKKFVANKARSILFSTHITADLERCAEKIVYIHKGCIKYLGNTNDLILKYASKLDMPNPTLDDVMVFLERRSDM